MSILKAIFTLGGYFAKRRAERRQERAEERELVLRAFETIARQHETSMAAIEKAIQTHSEDSQKQVALIQGWLDSFKTTAPPTSSALHDSDEARLERERQAIAAGIPPDVAAAPIEHQISWILRNT